MKKLLVDAGNSGIKWSILDNDLFTDMQSVAYQNQSSIEEFKKIIEAQLKIDDIISVIIVSVLGEAFTDAAEIFSKQHSLDFINVKSEAALAGVTNAYRQPYKLGADRFVALIAAHHLNKEKNCASIVVDTGTATTIDAINAQGKHLGGVILSGLDLCSESLLKNTKLLLAFNNSQVDFEPNIFSTSTKQAIASGSLYGLSAAINGICIQMEKEIQSGEQNKINKIICGGAAEKLRPYLSNDFQMKKDLIMHGLKIISKLDKNQRSRC